MLKGVCPLLGVSTRGGFTVHDNIVVYDRDLFVSTAVIIILYIICGSVPTRVNEVEEIRLESSSLKERLWTTHYKQHIVGHSKEMFIQRKEDQLAGTSALCVHLGCLDISMLMNISLL